MIKPDFLIKPYEVHSHPGLRPSDADIYAVVYWFERLKDGKCTASNETIAEVACVKERTVRAGLERLERYGFIVRVYEIENSQSEGRQMKNRLEIKTTVTYAKRGDEPKVHKTRSRKVKTEEMTPGGIVRVDAEEEKKDTPADEARMFFDRDGAVRGKIIDEIAEKTGAPREAVVAEMKKFYTYWT